MEVIPNLHLTSNQLPQKTQILSIHNNNQQTEQNKNELAENISQPKLNKKGKKKKNVRVKIDELSETESKGKKKSLQQIQNSSEKPVCKKLKVKTKSAKIIQQNSERKGNLATCIKSSNANKNQKSQKQIRSSKSIKFSDTRDVFTYKMDAKIGQSSKSKTVKKVPKISDEDKDCCVLF